MTDTPPKAFLEPAEFDIAGFTVRCVLYALALTLAIYAVYNSAHIENGWVHAIVGSLLGFLCLLAPYLERAQYRDHCELVAGANQTMDAHTFSTGEFLRLSRDKDYKAIESVVAERDQLATKLRSITERPRDEKGRFTKVVSTNVVVFTPNYPETVVIDLTEADIV